ncbi:hypothetical protein D3C84_1065290 [compost metagenome]
MLRPPISWLGLVSASPSSLKIARCRIIESSISHTAAIIAIAANAITINTLTDPSWRLGVEVNGR